MKIIGVDVGGTFTDVILFCTESGRHFVHKVPSTPGGQDIGVTNAVTSILENNQQDPSEVALVVHGTTVATNAMLERKGADVALIATEGVEDILEIGRQNRKEIYSLVASRPEPLVKRNDRFGVRERVDCTGEILTPLHDAEIARVVDAVKKRNPQSVAISLLFSFLNPHHERQLKEALHTSTDYYIAASTDVLPEFREFERTSTTVLEAYLGPLVVGYLERLAESLQSLLPASRLTVMQSNGGTLLATKASGNAIGLAISGLAGGVIGGWQIAQQAGISKAITLDMGGTSCDISAINGDIVVRSDNEVAGLPLRTPSCDVNTIGAGGGSIAWVDNVGVLHVGPQSAGAEPGPAAYAKGGGDATVTDANLILGRLNPNNFLGGNVRLDIDRAEKAIKQIAEELGLSVEETAIGIIRISTANMVQATREVTIERGFDPRNYVLVPFGGAGPTQAVDIAEDLAIESILVPPHPGITSALGLICTDLRVDVMQSILMKATLQGQSALLAVLNDLQGEASQRLVDQGANPSEIEIQWSIDMRYTGQSHELTIIAEESEIFESSTSRFENAHEEAYGYRMEGLEVEWVTARVLAKSSAGMYQPYRHEVRDHSNPIGKRMVLLNDGQRVDAEIYERHTLAIGQMIQGPAIIEQLDTTTYIGPEWRAVQREDGSLLMRREGA